MNSKEFIQKCLETESNNFEKIRERLSVPEISHELHRTLKQLIFYADRLDKLKKFYFYGQILPEGFETDIYPVNHYILNKVINDSDKHIRLLHAAMGIITEGVEFVEPILNSTFDGAELDAVNLIEELFLRAKLAYEESNLPEESNKEKAEKLLVSVLVDYIKRI